MPVWNAGGIALADRLSGDAVGDDCLDPVADLDPDPAILDRDEDEDAVVLALATDTLAAVLEHLDRVFVHVGIRLRLVARRDDHGVAARALERSDAPLELGALARSITCAKSLTGR